MESGCRLSRRPATLWDNQSHGRKFLFYWKIGKGYYLDIPSRLRSKWLAQDFGYKKRIAGLRLFFEVPHILEV